MYFVPNYVPTSTVLVRYDTQGPFNVPSSWLSFDLSIVDFAATQFSGAAFDGQYVYFATAPVFSQTSCNARPHMSLDRDAPISRSVEEPSDGKIVSLPKVAGHITHT